MSLIFISGTILLGFAIVLFTIGHLMLIIFTALPATRVLEMFGALKSFRTRSKKRDIIFDSYFLTPVIGMSFILILVTICFFFFLSIYFQYLIIGYIAGFLMIGFNYFVRKTYSFNKNSFQDWYMKNHIQDIDFELLRELKLENEDKLFETVHGWTTPEAQKEIKNPAK